AAAKDETDPLHAWAKTAAMTEPKQRTASLAPLLASWRKRQGEADAALKVAGVVIDYSQANADWIPDGVSFGLGPVRPGELRLGADAQNPIAKICDCGAAEKDPTWDVLKPATGAENDPGALGGVVTA